MRLLFLDIDGVLNNHDQLESGYCGIQQPQAHLLNLILDEYPDLKLVISSAWRYMTFRGDMTLRGFEMLLQICGVKAHERIIGTTKPDGEIADEPGHFDSDAWNRAGLKWRRQQIIDWLAESGCAADGTPYVVLDDLPLELGERFVQVDGAVGLRIDDVHLICRILA